MVPCISFYSGRINPFSNDRSTNSFKLGFTKSYDTLAINTLTIITEPPRIEKPMPAPRNTPPKIAINNLSDVIDGNSTKCTNTDNKMIEIVLRIANCHEI